MAGIIGIDFGTTNSAVSVLDGREPSVIINERGNRLTPTVVAFAESGDVLCGETAKNQALLNPEGTFLHFKRDFGKGYCYTRAGRPLRACDIAVYMFRHLLDNARAFFGSAVNEAVITVPADFSEIQRREVREAASKAGLRVLRLVNEPTAAALMHAARSGRRDEIILVYDLGGGTFDVTVLRKEGDVCTVLGSNGKPLGGADFDERILRILKKRLAEEFGIHPEDGGGIVAAKLRDEAERAKIDLSTRENATIALPFVVTGAKTSHFSHTLGRQEFELLIGGLVEETIVLTKKTVAEAGLKTSDLTALVLSGGSTRIPLVRRRLHETLGLEPVFRVNPEEIVAMGAALYADSIGNSGPSATTGRTQDSTGRMEYQSGRTQFQSGRTQFQSGRTQFQSGRTQFQSGRIELHDVTPHALGVEIEGGQFVPVIPRNAVLPARKSRVFTTISDHQRSVEVHVLQGDHSSARNNTSLGRFLLAGIRMGDKGSVRVEIVFSMDPDGILGVEARDRDTGVSEKIVLSPTGSQPAFGNAVPTGTGRRERVEALMARVHRMAFKARGRLDEEFHREIEHFSSLGKAALAGNDPRELSEAQTALETIIGELGTLEADFEVGYGRA